MKCHTAGIVYQGNLLEETFPDGIIKAGQWAHLQGWNDTDYKIVLLLPNGEINHRAIIQIYDSKRGKIIYENHYTTCGKFHYPMEDYESDIIKLSSWYTGDRYTVTAWVEY